MNENLEAVCPTTLRVIMRARREGTRGQGDKGTNNRTASMSISKYNLVKKTDSTSEGNISVKSQPIFKNYIGFETTKQFPTI